MQAIRIIFYFGKRLFRYDLNAVGALRKKPLILPKRIGKHAKKILILKKNPDIYQFQNENITD